MITARRTAGVAVAPRKTVQGRIIVVQEGRFRLMTPTGQGLLLTLSPFAPVSIADLRRWREAATLLTVTYTGEPGLASAVAKRLRPAPQSQ